MSVLGSFCLFVHLSCLCPGAMLGQDHLACIWAIVGADQIEKELSVQWRDLFGTIASLSQHSLSWKIFFRLSGPVFLSHTTSLSLTESYIPTLIRACTLLFLYSCFLNRKYFANTVKQCCCHPFNLPDKVKPVNCGGKGFLCLMLAFISHNYKALFCLHSVTPWPEVWQLWAGAARHPNVLSRLCFSRKSVFCWRIVCLGLSFFLNRLIWEAYLGVWLLVRRFVFLSKNWYN